MDLHGGLELAHHEAAASVRFPPLQTLAWVASDQLRTFKFDVSKRFGALNARLHAIGWNLQRKE